VTHPASRQAIGGEFELSALSFESEQQLESPNCEVKGTWTSCGRTALALILKELRTRGVTHLQLPAYLCDSILSTVKALDFQFSFYRVDDALVAQPEPSPNDAVLVINYFGWANPIVQALAPDQNYFLIEDGCQSFLSAWRLSSSPSHFFFTSPRKFGPTMLGGWCAVSLEENQQSGELLEQIARKSLAARLTRGFYLAQKHAPTDPHTERFYLEVLNEVEEFLNRHPVDVALPQLVLDLIQRFDWKDAARRRRANWLQLCELLSSRVETIFPSLPADVVPLGYLIRVNDRDRLRKKLLDQRIFCPIHWRLPAEITPERFPEAVALSERCLTLPIDQRYGNDDISRLAEAVLSAL
jgi:hypothetical protein